MELAKIKCQIDPYFYLTNHMNSKSLVNRVLWTPFIPFFHKAWTYELGKELSKQTYDETLKMDMNQTGMYRKLLANFLPVWLGCTVANIFELTKIIQMNPKAVANTTGNGMKFTDTLAEIIKYRR